MIYFIFNTAFLFESFLFKFDNLIDLF